MKQISEPVSGSSVLMAAALSWWFRARLTPLINNRAGFYLFLAIFVFATRDALFSHNSASCLPKLSRQVMLSCYLQIF
jgi:hypothetical protein